MKENQEKKADNRSSPQGIQIIGLSDTDFKKVYSLTLD